MRAWTRALALLWLGAAAGCTVRTTGAPCADDLQCPTGQHCGAEAVCVAGARSAAQLEESCREVMDTLAVRAAACHRGTPADFLTAAGATTLCASLEASVAAGRQDFRPEQVGACVRTLGEVACVDVPRDGTGWGELLARCAAFAPKVAEAGACASTADCADGWCSTSATCPGVCRRYVPAGGKCAAEDTCVPGTTCVTGECRTDARLAEGCSALGVQCGPDAYCGAAGTCEARKTEGPCAAHGEDAHAECAPGYACVKVSVDAGVDSPGECRPARALGEACTPGARECGALMFCDLGTGTCQAFPGGGAACDDAQKTGEQVGCLGARCDWASWFQRVCQPYLAPGASCSTDAQCGPAGACRSGACTPTWCGP